MTSWIKQSIKILPKKDSLLFETDDAGFCSQFNHYLYSVLFAQSQNTRLYVNDASNIVSIRYPLIQNTFTRHSDLSGVVFVDGPILTATSLKNRVIPMRMFLEKVSMQKFRAAATEFLQWNPSLVEKLDPLIEDIPSEIHVGVHLRGGDKIIKGEMKPIPIEQYIRQVELYQKKTAKTELNIFLMSDTPELLEQFAKASRTGWNLIALKSPLRMGGHIQREFNAASNKQRMDNYLHFMAELYTIQRAAHIVCTFTSYVGGFLALTAADTTTIVSLDDRKIRL
jgi:hypothetical protein